MSDLVIFDCDGVLVDSEVISNSVLADMLTREGLPTTLVQARREYQGLLLSQVAERAQARLGHPLPDGWIADYERTRAEVFRRELRPVSGAREAVEAVRRAGLGACVASQGSLAKTELSLQLTGLDDLFVPQTRFSAESVARGKPHPDLFLHAARSMSAEPASCVVVEDTPSGVAGARAAGMRAIGLAADSDPEALRAAGAELIGTLIELPAVLGLDGAAAAHGSVGG
jgi:HAD superfamily hydrolase (TIGR01509 family)